MGGSYGLGAGPQERYQPVTVADTVAGAGLDGVVPLWAATP
jgi:hypothetical protein